MMCLERVKDDRRLPPLAALMAIAIASRINRDTREVRVSYETLAADIGIKKRCAIGLVADLERCGHFIVEKQQGRGRWNTYKMVHDGAPFDEEQVHDDAGGTKLERLGSCSLVPPAPAPRRVLRWSRRQQSSRAWGHCLTRIACNHLVLNCLRRDTGDWENGRWFPCPYNFFSTLPRKSSCRPLLPRQGSANPHTCPFKPPQSTCILPQSDLGRYRGSAAHLYGQYR
jgi:hypothetical protein